MKYSEKNVLVSIAGERKSLLLSKIKEINKLRITRACLFLTMVKKAERHQIYKALLASTIKEIPLVHLKNEMGLDEILFLEENFHPTYYTIHENSFYFLHKWPGFKKRLYLETANNRKKIKKARVEAVAGFCIDLAHYKIGEKKQSEQYYYELKYANQPQLFACNHLNGYSRFRNKDLHLVRHRRDLEFLKTLPKFLFGKIIALEMENSIKEQLKWRREVLKILRARFN